MNRLHENLYFDHSPPKTKLGILATAWDEVSPLYPVEGEQRTLTQGSKYFVYDVATRIWKWMI